MAVIECNRLIDLNTYSKRFIQRKSIQQVVGKLQGDFLEELSDDMSATFPKLSGKLTATATATQNFNAQKVCEGSSGSLALFFFGLLLLGTGGSDRLFECFFFEPITSNSNRLDEDWDVL